MTDQVDLLPCPACSLDEWKRDVGCYLCTGTLIRHNIHLNPWPAQMVPAALAVEFTLSSQVNPVELYLKHGGHSEGSLERRQHHVRRRTHD